MSDLPSVLDRLLGTAAWTFAWQSTLWLVLGLLASRFLRRHAAQAHLLLVSATAAALLSPSLTLTVRHFECGLLPARQSVPNGFPATPTTQVEPSLVQPSEFPGQRKIVALSELASLAPVSSNLNSSSSYPSKSVPALDSHPLSASFKILVPAAFATCWLLASLVLTVRLMISLGAGHRIARDSRFRNKSGFADCAFRIGSCPGCSNRPSTPSVRLGPMPHDLVLGCAACALCAPIGGRDARSRLAECLLSRAGASYSSRSLVGTMDSESS